MIWDIEKLGLWMFKIQRFDYILPAFPNFAFVQNFIFLKTKIFGNL